MGAELLQEDLVLKLLVLELLFEHIDSGLHHDPLAQHALLLI